jgi:hypothetical protein
MSQILAPAGVSHYQPLAERSRCRSGSATRSPSRPGPDEETDTLPFVPAAQGCG